jgi:hypothetical protein
MTTYRSGIAVVAWMVLAGLSACQEGASQGPVKPAVGPDNGPTEPDQPATEVPWDWKTPPPVIGGGSSFKGESSLNLLSITPSKGLSTGSEQILITGTGFTDQVVIFFGESVAQDVFVLDTERLAVLTPPRIPGLVDVTASNPDTGEQSVIEQGFLFFSPIAVHGIDPAQGHLLGGEPVTVVGAGFTADSKLLVGGKVAISVQIVDQGTLTAITPEGVQTGLVDIHVSNELGVSILKGGFLYYDTPTLTAVTPAIGLISGGTQVTLSGSGFVEPLAVSFGGQLLLDAKRVSETQITGKTPTGNPGPVDVLVSTAYGAAVLYGGFTYLDSLFAGQTVELLSVSPPRGPAKGGNPITLVAKGLLSVDDTSVTIGGKLAKVVSVQPEVFSALVEAPAGVVGAVDVTLTTGLGSDTLAGGYVYDPFVAVDGISPIYGPVAGGTEVTVTGQGFAAGAQLRIGALAAASVKVVDETTLTAVTPPGSPGLANVTVIIAGLKDTLVGGFSYQGELGLFVVEPAQGSQSGGTQVQLMGSGFPTDAKVLIGGTPVTHLEVVSPTTILCKTPPGPIGSVEVTVASATKGTVSLPLAYTYFDPDSAFGGTWGTEVDGAVNVSVLNASNGDPIPDAFVMLWVDPETPYQGYTNTLGQITFSGPDLKGEQMVTASKEGFVNQSVVEYDAENLTLYMSPSTPSQGPPPPPVAPPIFKGQVVSAKKYIPVDWGKCSEQAGAPGKLCDVCSTHADCVGLNCSEIPGQGTAFKYCTSDCQTNAECPAGFMCYPLFGLEAQQCVPAAGEVTAFCDFTRYSIFSDDAQPDPGIQVNEDFSFEFAIPPGELAVYCWGGILKDQGAATEGGMHIQQPDGTTKYFVPKVLGLKRHVFALPGEEIVAEIVLNHPLKDELTVRLDAPPGGIAYTDLDYMWVYLELGSDGVIELLEHPYDYHWSPTGQLVVRHFPSGLTGDIYDATYTIRAGSVALTADYLPQSLTLHQGITNVQDDTMFRLGETGWASEHSGIEQNINRLWGHAEGDLIGVGSDGLIVRSIGTSWASQPSGTKQHLKDVHGVPEGAAIAVGDEGTAVHYDGSVWKVVPTLATADLVGVWMSSPTQAWAVGQSVILKYDAGVWTQVTGTNTTWSFRDVWGFGPGDVWAVANYGRVVHYDGSAWSTVATGTTKNLRSVWGSAPDDVYIAGEGGVLFHWDGLQLTAIALDVAVTLEQVWGTASDRVFVVGQNGTILRFDGTSWSVQSTGGYASTFLTVGGYGELTVATGTHELLLGPLLSVPVAVDPAEAGTMGPDYKITWKNEPGPDPHFSYVMVAKPGLFGPDPEWTMLNDWEVQSVTLPDLPNIEGTPGIDSGTKLLFILRVYKEGFDIDNYSTQDFQTRTWNSWAIDMTTFTKQ